MAMRLLYNHDIDGTEFSVIRSGSMNKMAAFYLCLGVLLMPLCGDSLVPNGFEGHLRASGTLKEGDVLVVEITQDLKLKLTSSRSSSNTVSFELAGGEGPDLFSFLPTGQTSRAKTLKSEEEVQLSAKMPVQITQIQNNGIAQVYGYRSMEADGGRQELSLNGSIVLASVSKGKAIAFDEVLNARLTYTSISEAAGQKLSESDFIKNDENMASADNGIPGSEILPDTEVPEQPAVAAEAVLPEAPADTNAAGTAVNQQSRAPQYSLTDERKKELFMHYMDEFMRLMFM